jgi:hypothetical protein
MVIEICVTTVGLAEEEILGCREQFSFVWPLQKEELVL